MKESQYGEPQWGQTVGRELLHQIAELRRRIDVLEAEPSLPGDSLETRYDDESPSCGIEVAELDPSVPAEDQKVTTTAEGNGIAGLPNGPIQINAVATAFGRGVRTLRGWCQVGKYDIPCHKEGGRWHFFRDELEAWHPEYREKSRRDTTRAQAKRRKTKNGKQQK